MMTLEEAFEKLGMPLYPQLVLKTCYEEPWRHYHNLGHIEEMLKHVPKDHYEVEIILDAILFHDIVQSPTPSPSGLNEALSVAEYLSYNAKALASNTPFGNNDGSLEYERRVIEAITATSRHLEDQQFLTEVSKLVLDLDLSTFALPWEEYVVWKDKIEKENNAIYGSTLKKIYHDDSFSSFIKEKRAQFLQKLLKRHTIYYIKTEWEESARSNIEKDIDSF
jgi:predicted metal-dependent HD superfamily phosphohydrolase